MTPSTPSTLASHIITSFTQWGQQGLAALSSPMFYLQLLAVAAAIGLAWWLSQRLKQRLQLILHTHPNQTDAHATHNVNRWQHLWQTPLAVLQGLAFPLSNILLLALVLSVFNALEQPLWLIKIAQSWAIIVFIFFLVKHAIHNVFISALLKWIGIPLAALYQFDLLSPTVQFLDNISFSVGDIRISVFAVLRLLVFGAVLFWLGRITNHYGQSLIRSKQTLDIRTREVFAKLFEIGLFLIIFLVLLQGVGIDLTALAVFGGALGVGIGFGLQQIASNFISGLIILLDKSIALGNYIEMEDGKAGTLTKLSMRSTSLQTFDGKVIVVPNERFITTAFTNWTHDDPRQRYSLTFAVAYDSDIPAIPKLILDAVKQHPQVLLEPELPDCEIIEFADSGVVFQLEYWIADIDDGKNRVGSDLFMIIWQTLHDNKISIPFPQREVRILNPQPPVPTDITRPGH
ncbi:mechanosensitive ion channel family protein [Thiomicrorhabdus aquaedulcis]|uniref:mechanosensitive ion channel family protein n=1 Tax=Thiomicrorhabdus aquaedulcis TaxID=2211106 RepID=UPI000FDB2FAB|nr:mechanosensitive ion channel domain-containing protein [Thiomicrorhabdus aquaedulcis]